MNEDEALVTLKSNSLNVGHAQVVIVIPLNSKLEFKHQISIKQIP